VVFEIPLTRRTLLLFFAGLAALVLLFRLGHRTPRYIEAERIWSVVRAEATARGLDPHFVFAIVMAESSGNAHAESNVARGMMQLTADTWAETTDLPYSRAFDWPTNIAVGCQRLANLRERLEARGRFTYPALAATYRYGFSAVVRREFDLARLPTTRNRIYRELFAGRVPPLADLGLASS
jgi:soluble lytic murein transglycosylase-like protein